MKAEDGIILKRVRKQTNGSADVSGRQQANV